MARRFIAGAVCPQCSLQDKIVMYRIPVDDVGNDTNSELIVKECVSCGFRESISADTNEPAELPTRVNQSRAGEQPLAHEDEVNIVNIMDLSNKTKH